MYNTLVILDIESLSLIYYSADHCMRGATPWLLLFMVQPNVSILLSRTPSPSLPCLISMRGSHILLSFCPILFNWAGFGIIDFFHCAIPRYCSKQALCCPPAKIAVLSINKDKSSPAQPNVSNRIPPQRWRILA